MLFAVSAPFFKGTADGLESLLYHSFQFGMSENIGLIIKYGMQDHVADDLGVESALFDGFQHRRFGFGGVVSANKF